MAAGRRCAALAAAALLRGAAAQNGTKKGVAFPPRRNCPKCPGDSYNCDEWIDWDPSRYTCQNLERQYDCDCTGCAHCGGSGSPNAAALVMLSQSKHNEARCLDGTMGGYYIRHGTSNNFMIYMDGGGWCYDQNCRNPTESGTLSNCQSRSSGTRGSSKDWPNVQDTYLSGYQSVDPRENPTFHDWTLVWLPHCDGTSFSGDAVVGGLHFRGRKVLEAVIDELRDTTGIRDAQTVVVSGGSAGASGVYWHADTIAEQLALRSGEVLALPDAGFFLDLKDTAGVDCWPNQMRSLFETSNGYASLHKGCLAKFPQAEQWKCLFPEYYAELISTRTFVLNSFYDNSEMWATLQLNCCPPNTCSNYPTCSNSEMAHVYAMRQQHIDAWRPLVSRQGHGVWGISCITHTLGWWGWTDSDWEVPARSGNTMSAVVARWLAGDDSDGKGFVHEDPVEWPNNAPCRTWSLAAANATGNGERPRPRDAFPRAPARG